MPNDPCPVCSSQARLSLLSLRAIGASEEEQREATGFSGEEIAAHFEHLTIPTIDADSLTSASDADLQELQTQVGELYHGAVLSQALPVASQCLTLKLKIANEAQRRRELRELQRDWLSEASPSDSNSWSPELKHFMTAVYDHILQEA